MQYTTEYKTENGKTKKVPEKKEQAKKTSSSNTNDEDSTKTTPYTGE